MTTSASTSKSSARAATSRRAWADWAGMAASIGCAVHCAAMPFALAYIPSLGSAWVADEGFHQWMAVVCFALAAVAFVPGWTKHRSIAPAVLGTAGVVLLATSAYALEGSCCPHCSNGAPPPDALSEHGVVFPSRQPDNSASAKVRLASLAGFGLPLFTPLGGALLILGHLVNHRKVCSCSRCRTP